MSLTDGVAGGSVAVGGVAHGDEGSVSVGEIAGLSISAPLASQTLWRPGHEGGGSSVSISIAGISIGSIVVWGIEVAGFSLSISTPLSVAAIAGGLGIRGADSWPVGVGIVEGWVGTVEVPRVGISLAGGDGDNGSSNLRRKGGSKKGRKG